MAEIVKTIKLDWSKVARIRELHNAGGYTYQHLANLFDVKKETIKSVVRGETWPEEKRPAWHQKTFNLD